MRRARHTVDDDEREWPSFQIRELHKREVKTWETSQLQAKFGSVACWRYLRKLDSKISGRFIVEQPSLDDFAHMLAQMFSAMSLPPEKLDHLTERPLALRELKRTVHYLKSNKSGDHIGLVAEMLRYVPDDFLAAFVCYSKKLFT